MKTGPDAPGTAENESERAKQEKKAPTPSVPPKMSTNGKI
jgi:hypothetical protein